MYGLQYREKSVAESLSKLSLNDFHGSGGVLGGGKENVVVTGPHISAVLVAVLLEFIVGFNIGVIMVQRGSGGEAAR